MAVRGNYAYVAASQGLQVIDVSNPANPVWVGGYLTVGYALDIAVSGGYAYVADEWAGLQVIDVSDPASPVWVGGYETSGDPRGVAVSGSYAYLAREWDGLEIVSIGIPTAEAPGILQQPLSRTVLADRDTGISVTASGSFPLRYQWYQNAMPVAGRTNAWLSFRNIQPAQAGQYYVVVTNAYGAVTSSVATVTVCVVPRIDTTNGGLGFSSGAFGFSVRASEGQAVVIEASTNLATWVPIQTNVVTAAGTFEFKDPESAVHSRRFYRARLHDGPLSGPSIPAAGGGCAFNGGQFEFPVSGIPGEPFVVEMSTNLVSWAPIRTNTLTSLPFQFTDQVLTNVPARFYRVRSS